MFLNFLFAFITLFFSHAEEAQKHTIPTLLEEVRNRTTRYNWDQSIFSHSDWKSQGSSVSGRPLIFWTCGDSKNVNTTLILSSVHGDEVTPIYFGFRVVDWIKSRPELCNDSFIVVAPLVNPDGFLRYTNGTRTNYNKVDLNRNFKTPDWDANALKNWKTKYGSQQRYFPGNKPESEPEVHFQKWLINEFKPGKILSVHSPLNMLDYDGPLDEKPDTFTKDYIDSIKQLRTSLDRSINGLKVFSFGTYPGSLGNYAGKILGIPTVTVELPTSNYTLAASYFGQFEEGLKNFITNNLKDAPKISQQ